MAVPLVSTSELQTFRRCRFQWYYSYVLRLKPKTAAPALRFGSLIHKPLELYFKPGIKRGPNPADTFTRLYEEELKEQTKIGFRDEDGTWQEAGELGVAMLEHYLEEYGDDDEWDVIASEQRFEQPILGPAGHLVGIYIGVIDKIMRHRPTNRIEFWDHKSAKSIKTNHLTLDPQSSGYWTFGGDWARRKGLLKPGQNLGTLRFDFLRKAKKDERKFRISEKGTKIYLNQNGTDSKTQPSPFFLRYPSMRGEHERTQTRWNVAATLREMRLVRADKLDVYKSPGMFTCMGCPILDICELHEAGADHEELTRLTMVPRGSWKPEEYIDEAIVYEHEH